ncbi:MAG: ATP-binding protein [Acidobacteriota bacterium]
METIREHIQDHNWTVNKLMSLLGQQKLLADIAQELNSPQKLDKSLEKVLVLLGMHTNVSRVYIFEDSPDGNTTSNTFEWCNSGIEPQRSELQDIPYEVIPSWKKILTEKGRVFSKNIDELPQDLVDILKPQNIKSILVYPLYVSAMFYGFIGFDECVENKTWPIDETELLRAVSSILSNAFERRQVIRKLKESELRLKLALSSAKEGLWDWNIKTGEVYFSDVWCRMLGYEPHEIEPNVKSWEMLLHPDDKPLVWTEMKKFLSGDNSFYETIHRLKTKDGKWKWILDHGMVIERDEENEPLRAIGTHIDVTGQKETELQLKNLISTKDKFFSIIAHDLKNPFTVLLGYSEIILEDAKNITPEDLGFYVSNIHTVSKNTHALLENLLIWARSQRGDLKITPEMGSVSALACETVGLLSAMAENKQISLINVIPEEVTAWFDRDAILTVIRNLMTNSIKFTKPGGHVGIRAVEMDDKIEIEIYDNGIGMESHVLEKLFRTETNHTTRGTSDEKGSGLGLILCKELVEKNGGTIRAISRPGEGSTFIFTLPRQADEVPADI